MSENTRNIPASALKCFVTELFTAGGMQPDDAKFFAQTIVQSNLWGIDSHGIIRVPVYFDRILCKAINPNANIQVEKLAPAVSIVDGDGGAGCVVAKRAMEQAIENAKNFGIGAVGVTNSNHFGAAALYSKMAIDAGMVGISMTNVLPLIAAPGAKAPVVGNNPLSIGIPTYNEFPFLLDMSLSVVAGGKLHLAAAKGNKIPLDWAVDKNGRPTDDPKEALAGFLLPMGGYKGLGLAYAVDILSGVITGGLFADKMRSMYKQPTDPSLTGHMMIALNLSAFITPEQMKERMEYYHNYITGIPMADGAAPLCFPGEIEHNRELERAEIGIPVPLSTLETLARLKETYHLVTEL
ncbi:MAG: Ldh family oxidoreductase [Hydrogenoanaerobacterium sp.]